MDPRKENLDCAQASKSTRGRTHDRFGNPGVQQRSDDEAAPLAGDAGGLVAATLAARCYRAAWLAQRPCSVTTSFGYLARRADTEA